MRKNGLERHNSDGFFSVLTIIGYVVTSLDKCSYRYRYIQQTKNHGAKLHPKKSELLQL